MLCPLRLLMLFLVGVLCVLFVPTTVAKECNPKIHYNLKNGTSPEIIKCVPVRSCPPGKEPQIPCGSDIDIDDVIGLCKTCDNGTFSFTSGPEPCQICRGANCSKDQIAKGTCSTIQDNSSCACKDGLAMNRDGSACEVYKSQISTTKYKLATTKKATTETMKPTTKKATTKKPTTEIPSTERVTAQKASTQETTTQKPASQKGLMNFTPSTKNLTSNNATNSVASNDQKVEKDGIEDWEIAVYSVITFVLIFIIIALCWCLHKRCKRKSQSVKCRKKLPCYTLKQFKKDDAVSKEEKVKFGTEENTRDSESPDKPHCPETSGGYHGKSQY